MLEDISAKRCPVKFVTTLAATFFNISAENYTNIWFKSNAIDILFKPYCLTGFRVRPWLHVK